ncbi:MAG: hypothetical protein QXE01_02190 [Sulfolobales archaeon]
MGAILLVDLDRIDRDQNLLGKILMKVRYGRLGSLTIYLITGNAEIKTWAERVRDALSKNFDVTIYLYSISDIEKGFKKVVETCSNNYVYVYREIPDQYLKELTSYCEKVEIV